jgi:antitoxin YefM
VPHGGTPTRRSGTPRPSRTREQVNNDHTPVEITSKNGDAVLMSRADYDALEETAYLFRVPANAARLLESLDQAGQGERHQHDLL